jgi:hypothetical protein
MSVLKRKVIEISPFHTSLLLVCLMLLQKDPQSKPCHCQNKVLISIYKDGVGPSPQTPKTSTRPSKAAKLLTILEVIQQIKKQANESFYTHLTQNSAKMASIQAVQLNNSVYRITSQKLLKNLCAMS